MMPTFRIGSRNREPAMVIVPSTAGFPLVFKFARTRGCCRLSTRLGLVMAIAALAMAAVPFAPAAAAGSEHHITAARASAIHERSVLASRYSQHDWGNTEIYLYRSCMATHDQRE
jgi:hypothetical protein